MAMLETHRVVITGMGVISPLGSALESFWESLAAGRHGIGPVTTFDTSAFRCSLVAEARGYDPADWFDRREARRMDRFCQFAMAAAQQAMTMSGLDMADCDPFRIGTIVGSGVGGLHTTHAEFDKFFHHGINRVSPLFIPMMISNMAAGTISMKFGTKGDCTCVTTACASGAHSIGEAYRAIRYGHLDACIAGGCEAPITPIALAGFSNMTALSESRDPDRASIPFDRERDGFIMGEGAGILVLESLSHARKRGARIVAEICGYGSTSDAYHITSPDPEGAGAAAAMRLAMEEAGIRPDQVGYINAHGTSTPLNDKYETLSIRRAMGDFATRTPVSSTKSMTGHLLGAAGAVECIASVQALVHGLIPPTVGYRVPDPECDLDYVPEGARPAAIRYALSNSLGFGGHNATLCMGRWEEESR